MSDFFSGMLFGGLQVILLALTLLSLKKKKLLFAIAVVIVKFSVYAWGISTLYRKYYSHLFRCIMGYFSGMPVFAFLIIVLFYSIKYYMKKSGKGHHIN